MRQSIIIVAPVLQAAVEKANFNSAQLTKLQGSVAKGYAVLGRPHKIDDAWAYGKGRDAFDSGDKARQLCKYLTLRADLKELVQSVFAFIAFSADIGRLVVRNEHKDGDKSRGQAVHGAASVEWINALPDRPEGELWDAMMIAIKHHSDRLSPTLEQLGGNQVAYYLCLVLRHLDKMSNWSPSMGADYYLDPVNIERESKQNNVVDEPFATEEIVQAFVKGQPIDRDKCQSYVDYMLQFLGWFDDDIFQELLDEILPTNGPQRILAWIRDRLMSNGYARHWYEIEAAARRKHGIVLKQ